MAQAPGRLMIYLKRMDITRWRHIDTRVCSSRKDGDEYVEYQYQKK